MARKNHTETYSTHNEGKYLITKRFIRTVQNIINTWLQYQNVYIDKLYDIVNKYNNKYHNAIKMKLVELM